MTSKCPNCKRPSLYFDDRRKQARCSYRGDCGFTEPVATYKEFHDKYEVNDEFYKNQIPTFKPI